MALESLAIRSTLLCTPSAPAITMLSTAFLIHGLLATAAFALPSSKERMAARRARRGVSRQSKPANIITNQVTTDVTNTTNEEFSSNWAGAVLIASTATYQSVTGTFTVPNPQSTGGSSEQCATAWVGIDGDTCSSAILQTGVDFCVTGSSVSYDGWYEFFPAASFDFSGISFSAGDSVTSSAGTLTIKNNSKGQTVSKAVTSSASLCQTNAEWIVEDFEECSGSSCSLVPFANFGSIEFTGASAATSSGSITPAGATIIDIEQNGEVLTSSSVSGSTVSVTYK
ncbi:hypothetical protein GYMLUDRAFT_654194 [Collybiopsis luxurians FD-317 M1]|uniref:Unplaced genomic scaffold GYMLUscaffold_30, whole genome shotgun sequence n=1 Tax=Collybiopsis luxurians FD-317 M1 TaxID=944289 RepID=A0A0D0B861_9AGAR|nr:hypothetical protein GYMLUDRAFT_654194 [Collybiopsis luxurians FD-317 M1]